MTIARRRSSRARLSALCSAMYFESAAIVVLLRLRRRLREAQEVAEGVAEAAIDAVRPLRGLLRELDALRLELVVGPAAVVGREEQVPAGRALRDEVADLRRGLLVH